LAVAPAPSAVFGASGASDNGRGAGANAKARPLALMGISLVAKMPRFAPQPPTRLQALASPFASPHWLFALPLPYAPSGLAHLPFYSAISLWRICLCRLLLTACPACPLLALSAPLAVLPMCLAFIWLWAMPLVLSVSA